MWRSTLLALAFLILSPFAFAQFTTTSGTITDAGSQAWISGTFSFVFKTSPTNPVGPYFFNGAPFATAQTIAGALDPSGHYSVSIPSNTSITPSGSLWTATFCPLATASCFTQDFTITGASQTVQPIPPAISINLISPQQGPARAYADGEISSAAIGSIYYNIISTSYRSCIAVSGQTCTTWQNIAGGGGSGNCNVQGNVGDLQKKATGACAASSINDNGAAVNIGEQTNVNANFTPKGQNPYYDITNPAYGAVADNISGTASCNGTNTITTTSILSFVLGEGVWVAGCGPTPTLPAAPTPTVTTGNTEAWDTPNAPLTSATGSNTESILIVLRDLRGGIGLPGTPTTISNALPLGMQTSSVTSTSSTGNSVSVTVPSALAIAANAQVRLNGTSNVAQNTGLIQVTSVTGGGTVINGTWANYSTGTVASTGGTLTWSNGVQATFTTPGGTAWQALICVQRQGEGAYHLRGKTDPILANYTGSGYSDYQYGTSATPTVNTWTDWGATLTNPSNTFASYENDTLCTAGSVTNEFLSTTITGGIGTTSLTVANSASQTASGQTIQSDNAPALIAADAAAYNPASSVVRGTVYIPNAGSADNNEFQVHTPVLLRANYDGPGNIATSETITFKGQVEGRFTNYNKQQFAWNGTSRIRSVFGGYPTVILDCSNCGTPRNMVIDAEGNAGKALLIANPNNVSVGPDLALITGTTGSGDYCGMPLEAATPFNMVFQGNNYIQSGPNQTSNSSWCPAIYYLGTTAANISYIDGHLSQQSRGIVADGGNFGVSITQTGTIYGQGCVMPPINFINTSRGMGYKKIGDTLCDTSVEPNYSALNVGGSTTPGDTTIYRCRQTSAGGGPCYEGTVPAVPVQNDDAALNGSGNTWTVMYAPGTSGRNANGEIWANHIHLIPALSIPTPVVGFNFGFLNADTLPSFKDINANKYFLASWLSTIAITNNHCVNFVVSAGIATLGDSGSPCSSGNFIPNSLMTTLGDMIYENATPAPARLPGPTAPNGVPQTLTNTPLGGAAQAEAWALSGVPVNNNAETTCATYTLNVLDRATNIECSAGTTATITIPVHTTAGFANNFPVDVTNFNSGTLTATTTSPDTIDGGSAGGSQTVLSNWDAHFRQDVNGNWHTIRVPMFAAFGTTCGDATHALNWSTTTGFGCQSISASAITVQTNSVNNTSQTTLNLLNSAPFNGLTFTFTNTSAGNVQAGFSGTLGNGGLTNSSTTVNGVTCTLGSTCTPLPNSAGSSDVTNQSSSQGAVTLATAPPAGHYVVNYYADLNSACPTGANTVSFTFNWTDVGGARSDTTGNLTMGTSQLSSSYMTGVFPIWADGTHNVTYTSTVNGSCASGTSSYDIHVTLERIR